MTSSLRHILILRPGAIGDTLLTFPSLMLLRRRFPEARMTVVGNRAALGLALKEGLVDEIDAFGAEWVADLFGDEPTAALRGRLEGYDLGVVWMHSSDAASDLATRLESAGVRRAVPLVSFPDFGSWRHVADHLIDTLDVVGIGGPRPPVLLRPDSWPVRPPLPTGEGQGEGRPRSGNVTTGQEGRGRTCGPPLPDLEGTETIRPSRFRQLHGAGADRMSVPVPQFTVTRNDGPETPLTPTLSRGERGEDRGAAGSGAAPLAVLHPGAGAKRKRWPAERYAALGARLISRGYQLAVTSGPADEDAVAALRAALPTAPVVLSGLELADLAAVLSRADLVVGNDSGVTHLAALGGAPTLALFGPFDPAYWSPIGPRVGVVDAGHGCAHRQDPRDGCRQCDLLSSLDVETVWEAVQALVQPSNAD